MATRGFSRCYEQPADRAVRSRPADAAQAANDDVAANSWCSGGIVSPRDQPRQHPVAPGLLARDRIERQNLRPPIPRGPRHLVRRSLTLSESGSGVVIFITVAVDGDSRPISISAIRRGPLLVGTLSAQAQTPTRRPRRA